MYTGRIKQTPFHSKIYDLEIERMQLISLLIVFAGVSFLFLSLLSFGSMGPKKLILDNINQVYCENEVKLSSENDNFEENVKKGNTGSYKCILCKDFRFDQSAKIMNFQIDLFAPQKDLSLFKEPEKHFNMSVLESLSIVSNCKSLSLLSNKNSFPSIDSKNLQKMNQDVGEYKAWNVLINNTMFNGVPNCDRKDEETKQAKCIIDAYGNLNFSKTSKSLAIMLSIPFSPAQKEKLEKSKFFLIYDNEAFYNFVFLFQVFISIASLIAFIFIIRRLSSFQFKDWLSIHKWILALLLTQAFLDNTFSILNDYSESKVFQFFSELGKNIHLTLLLYFWTSVFDKILIQHLSNVLFNEWAEKIKVTLLTSFFILNFSYNLYVGIESLENEYEDLFQLRILLDFIKFIITFLEISYGFYFIILTILFLKLVHEGKITKDRTSVILFSFTCISFILTTINLVSSPYSESSFEYLAVRGFIGIYTITVGLLYIPSKAQKHKSSELDMTAMNEREQIIKNAYEIEESIEEEQKSPESETEKQKKRLIWERIQKQVETEEETKPEKEEPEDEEYIYM